MPPSFAAFAVSAGANGLFVIVQVVAGLAAGSVALLADGLHNAGDVLGLLAAWGAMSMGRWWPTSRHTYGWGRTSILAALGNAIVLLLGCGAIALEAVQRFAAPAPVATGLVMAVATFGILVNGGSALLFLRGQGDINVRATFLHLAGDAAVSAGVVLSALLIRITGWAWLDPVTSLLVAALITWSTWGLLKQSVALAIDAVPSGIDPAAVRAALLALPGVSEVHDLHIWGLSTTRNALTAHLVVLPATTAGLAEQACALVRDRFGIEHATVQLEAPDHAARCALRPAEVV